MRSRCASLMDQDWNTLWTLALQLVGGLCFVCGGLRFRSWAVEDRAGIPRFPSHVETVLLWLVYSGGVAIVIIVCKQTLRHL